MAYVRDQKKIQKPNPNWVRVVAVVLLALSVGMGVAGVHRRASIGPNWFAVAADDLYANLATSLFSIAITVLLIDALAERRAAAQEKTRILEQLRSQSNDFALEALRLARVKGWTDDGAMITIDVSSANLAHADLSKVYLSQADLSNANFAGANFYCAKLNGIWATSADFTEANFWNADLTRGKFWRAKFVRAQLRGATLIRAHAREADFTNALLYEADLSDAELFTAVFRNANLSFAILRRVAFEQDSVAGANFYRARLDGAFLRGLDLRGAEMRETSLIGADLAAARLQGCKLEGADATGASFDRADLRNANCNGVIFRNADLCDANFAGAKFGSATLIVDEEAQAAEFYDRPIDLSGAKFCQHTIWPSGFDAIAAGAILQRH